MLDGYSSFKKILADKLMDGSFKNIWEIATDHHNGIVVEEIQIVPTDHSYNILDIRQLPSNDTEFTDIHRVIRKNMNLMGELFEAFDEYKKPDSIIAIYENVKAEVNNQKNEN